MQTIPNPIPNTGALSAELLASLIVLIVISTELGHMHHTFDKEALELYKEAKISHACNRSRIFLAEMITHVVTL